MNDGGLPMLDGLEVPIEEPFWSVTVVDGLADEVSTGIPTVESLGSVVGVDIARVDDDSGVPDPPLEKEAPEEPPESDG
jgi:hypothetical protein